MIHGELVNTVLKGHCAVFSAGLLVFLGFIALSWPFKSAVEGSKKILAELRKKLIDELGGELRSVFEKASHVQKVGDIVGPNGERWLEEPVNFLESEEFGNTLFYFVEKNAGTMADYRVFREIVERCNFWGRYFGFSVLFLLVSQLVIIGVLWAGDKVCEISMPNPVIKWLILVPVLTGANCFVGLICLLRNRGKSIRYKDMYE